MLQFLSTKLSNWYETDFKKQTNVSEVSGKLPHCWSLLKMPDKSTRTSILFDLIAPFSGNSYSWNRFEEQDSSKMYVIQFMSCVSAKLEPSKY